jgi:hypothetical protein
VKKKKKILKPRSPIPPPSQVHKDKREEPRAKEKTTLRRSWRDY